MEIVDYIKGRWLTVLLVAPVIAGLIAGACLLVLTKPTYQAAGEVDVITELGGSPSGLNNNNVIANFRSALTSDEVVDQVADELSIPASEVRSGLRSSLDSPDVTAVNVTFQASDSEKATNGLSVAVRDALIKLAGQQREVAQSARDTAATAAEQAKTDLAAFDRTSGLPGATLEYQQRGADLLTLRNQIAVTTSPDALASLNALYDQKVAERDRYGQILLDYQHLVNLRDKADSALADKQSALTTINTQVQTLESAEPVSDPRVTRSGRWGIVIQGVIGAMIVTVAIVLALALISRRRNASAD